MISVCRAALYPKGGRRGSKSRRLCQAHVKNTRKKGLARTPSAYPTCDRAVNWVRPHSYLGLPRWRCQRPRSLQPPLSCFALCCRWDDLCRSTVLRAAACQKDRPIGWGLVARLLRLLRLACPASLAWYLKSRDQETSQSLAPEAGSLARKTCSLILHAGFGRIVNSYCMLYVCR